jgi:putative lipoprotein
MGARGHRILITAGLAVALAACATDPSPSAAGMTRVSGTVSYRQRVALAPGSTLIVTLEDASRADTMATVLGKASIPIQRQQVPIDFAIEVESGRIDRSHRYTVRARILDPQGALRWTSTQAYLVLTGGSPNSIEILVHPVQGGSENDGAASTPTRTLVFVCENVEFVVRMDPGEVRLVLPDGMVLLPRVAAASGEKYEQGGVVFWGRGNHARIEIEGTVYPACDRQSVSEPRAHE